MSTCTLVPFKLLYNHEPHPKHFNKSLNFSSISKEADIQVWYYDTTGTVKVLTDIQHKDRPVWHTKESERAWKEKTIYCPGQCVFQIFGGASVPIPRHNEHFCHDAESEATKMFTRAIHTVCSFMWMWVIHKQGHPCPLITAWVLQGFAEKRHLRLRRWVKRVFEQMKTDQLLCFEGEF